MTKILKRLECVEEKLCEHLSNSNDDGTKNEIINGSQPPTNEESLWLNTTDNLLYFNNGEYWITSQIFQLDFNDPGTTNNNTWLRFGSLVTNINRGTIVQHNALFISASFNRNNTSNGSIVIYSNSGNTNPNEAQEVFSFDISGLKSGTVSSTTGSPEILANSFLAPRWEGNTTNNVTLILNYRKVYLP